MTFPACNKLRTDAEQRGNVPAFFGLAGAGLNDVTVQRCAVDGIQALQNAALVFRGTVTSSNNTRDGVNIADSSSAFLQTATFTANANARHGISVAVNSGVVQAP